MKKTFKSVIAIVMSLCMLGAVTACGDSDDDDKGTDRKSSSAYSDEGNKKSNSDSKKSSKNDDDDDKKDDSKDNDDKEEQAEINSAVANIYISANSVLADKEDEGKMSDILNSSDPVIVCSDKSKNVNASGLDSDFYDCMQEYCSRFNELDWFVVINKGACEYAACTKSGSKYVGQKPSDSYSGKSYEEIYNTVVSEIE